MAPIEIDDLYGNDVILDHCRHPRNLEVLDNPTISGQAVNRFCGDEVDIQVDLASGRVLNVGVQGRGCSINQATSSMLSDAVVGKNVEEIGELADLFRNMMGGAAVGPTEAPRLGHLQTLSAVLQFPVRIKCALLSWSALEEGIEEYGKGQPD